MACGDAGASRIVSGMTFDWSGVRPVPEPRSRRGRETRQQILEAAADLFAERGVDRVEIGEILEAAGQRNAAAIHYYFGSRDGLILAVLQPRHEILDALDSERARMIDTFLTDGSEFDLEDAVRVLVEPTWILLGSHAGRSFARVAAEVVRSLPIDDRVAPANPSSRRTLDLIAVTMPALPDQIRRQRIGTAFTMYLELVAGRAREIEHGLPHHLDDGEYLAEIVAMVIGLIAAPMRRRSAST